jgi:hypothetical protein
MSAKTQARAATLPARWLLVALALAACDAPLPPAPAQSPAVARTASSAPSASGTPTASATASATGGAIADAPRLPPPLPCPPRAGHAALGYAIERSDRRGKYGSLSLAAPRFTTSVAELRGAVLHVQAEIDGWMKRNGGDVKLDAPFGPGKNGTATLASTCEVTRNDGDLLAILCTNEFSLSNWRSGVQHSAFVFQRTGNAWKRVDLQSFARNPKASLLARASPNRDKDADEPLDPEFDGTGPTDERPYNYVTLRDGEIELGPRAPFNPIGRSFAALADLRQHLTCDEALDMPSGPPRAGPQEAGALAVATRIVESGDPAVAAYWFGTEPTIERPRFVSLDARNTAAAKTLNDAIDAYLAGIQARAKTEAWKSVQAFCRVETSTEELVSVLCYGGGSTPNDDTKTARASITLRLGQTPQRVDDAEVFARRPGLPAEIARRCLGHLVRKPTFPEEEVLRALPRITARELDDFAVSRSGMLFAVEYELVQHHRLTPCFLPYAALGTSFAAFTGSGTR